MVAACGRSGLGLVLVVCGLVFVLWVFVVLRFGGKLMFLAFLGNCRFVVLLWVFSA